MVKKSIDIIVINKICYFISNILSQSLIIKNVTISGNHNLINI